MKKKIAILGSTGSIGKSLIEIIKKDKKNFETILLTADTNGNKLIKQAKLLNVKNLIITNKSSFENLIKKKSNKRFNIYNDYQKFNKIFKNKVDYVMNSISGINGLKPTLEIIKYTKSIAVANKESIICGWNLINKRLKFNKTKFIPIDSEHFSINELIKHTDKKKIEKVYITASGGPFLNYKLSSFKNIKIKNAIDHPTWQMGKKISIDSATLINKVYELIEAQKIFNLDYSKFHILIQPSSYVHSIIKFYGGILKVLIHNTSMTIPIFNSLYDTKKFESKFSTNINIELFNNLNLQKVPIKKFPINKILTHLPKTDSLFETVLVSANDTLVNLFLSKKISFNDIHSYLNKILSLKEFQKYKSKKPKNLGEILLLNEYVRLKTESLSVV
ncbi:1-deoxy-D-xylulose-5-phosphate reductoisomerase [Candidatus Pelagibacter sp.]|nr:1-deoxy-D-xylulose-5-phosphate reductoisomerase [Candidatus Pelagibacter sp.]